MPASSAHAHPPGTLSRNPPLMFARPWRGARRLLVACWMCGAALAGETLADGHYHLTLDDAVPYEGPGEGPKIFTNLGAGNEWHDVRPGAIPWDSRNPRTPFRDLILDLERRDGAWSPGWAWVACLPGIEQRATVENAKRDGDAITLTVAVTLGHHLQRAVGGTASYTITLDANGPRLDGTFTGKVSDAFAGLDPDQMKKAQRVLWAEWGDLKKKPAWAGRVMTGSPTSLARGRILPLPPALTWSAHPRLLFTAAAMRQAAANQTAADAAPVRATLIAQLAGEGDSGLKAAGLAFLARSTDEKTAPDQPSASRRAGAAAMEAIAAPGTRFAMARRIAAVAVAYDACAQTWPAEQREAVAAWLRAAAASHASGRKVPGFARSDPPLGSVSHPADPLFVAERAAAGLAALAVIGDPAPPADTLPPDVAVIAEMSARTVRRFLEVGIGEHGAGPGHSGFAASLELIVPFAMAWRQATGRDLTTRTGLPWTPVLGMVSCGTLLSGEGLGGSWLALGCAVMPEGFRGAARARLAGWKPADPFIAALALIAWPSQAADGSPGALPLNWEDRASGTYVFRSGPDEARDAMLTVELAGLPTPGHHLAFNIGLRALGRPWLVRGHAPPGVFAWPERARQNVVRIEEAAIQNQRGMEPNEGGALARVQVTPTTATVSGHIHPIQSMRTVAADWSGRCGAPVLLVVADKIDHAGMREKCWQADVGDVPADRVVLGDGWIEVRPTDSAGIMRLTAIEPLTAWLAYDPPVAGKQGGRVKIWARKPGKKQGEMMEDALKPTGSGDADSLLEGPSERETKAKHQQEVRVEEARLAGVPDDEFATDHASTFVIAITIGEGAPPPAKSLGNGLFVPPKGRGMRPSVPFQIGKRRAAFDYFTIGFYDVP